MYIDSHAHLSSGELFPLASELIDRARASGVEKIVNICTDPITLERGLLLKERCPAVFLAASATPHDGEESASFFFEVEKAAKAGSLVAIGETGLDYHYEHADRSLQKKQLTEYCRLARETKLPVIFHCREAFEDLFAAGRSEYQYGAALLHCFTGNLEEAKRVLDLGWFISFSGIVTFKKSETLREVVKYVPLDRMLIETDSPYLAPQSKRGKVNEPSFIGETALAIAHTKGVPLEEVALQTKQNAALFFSF